MAGFGRSETPACRLERPLNGVLQPSRREIPVWIVEPPLSVGERLTVPDP